MKKELKQGFTLIELVVVMAIIAVLAALMVAALSAARKQSVSTQVTGDTKTYEVALETYASGNTANPGKYPVAAAATQVNTATTGLAAVLNGGTKKYLSSIPSTNTIFYISNADGSSYTMLGCAAGTTGLNGTITPGTEPAAAATPCTITAGNQAAIYEATK